MKKHTLSDESGGREVTIRIGENAKENDQLFLSAAPGDWWFHLDQRPSAHLWLASSDAETISKRMARNCAKVLKTHSGRSGGERVCYTQRQFLAKDKTCSAGTLILVKEPYTVKV